MVSDDIRQVFAELAALKTLTERLLTETLMDMPEDRKGLVIANLRGALSRTAPPRAPDEATAELTGDIFVRAQTCIDNILDNAMRDPRLAG